MLNRHFLPANNLKGKKAAFLGDSITAGAGAGGKLYFNHFGDITGMVVKGYGNNGASIGDRNDVQIYQEVNGYDETQYGTTTHYDGIDGDESLVSVFAGTNDFGHDVPLGDFYYVDPTTGEKSAPRDGNGDAITATFAGGLHKLINDIRDKAPNAKIVFMTPTSRIEGTGISFNSHRKNNAQLYLQDYVACIKDICSFYCIPVLDLLSVSQIDLTDTNYSRYSYDGLHIAQPAHKEIGYLLARFVNNNIVIL